MIFSLSFFYPYIWLIIHLVCHSDSLKSSTNVKLCYFSDVVCEEGSSKLILSEETENLTEKVQMTIVEQYYFFNATEPEGLEGFEREGLTDLFSKVSSF